MDRDARLHVAARQTLAGDRLQAFVWRHDTIRLGDTDVPPVTWEWLGGWRNRDTAQEAVGRAK
jgi:hypothetical protein